MKGFFLIELLTTSSEGQVVTDWHCWPHWTWFSCQACCREKKWSSLLAHEATWMTPWDDWNNSFKNNGVKESISCHNVQLFRRAILHRSRHQQVLMSFLTWQQIEH